jgi:glycosyltransferase involved in cell wall biosynthesis
MMKVIELVTVILLTKNEEIHIRRCIESLLLFTSSIFVVDSYSSDETVKIAVDLGATVVQREWKNYADQFQWALDNYEEHLGASDWLMRMDADEYIEEDLAREIVEKLAGSSADGYTIRRKVFFSGQWIKHGGFYPQILLRIWRAGAGRIEQRWMDEHIVMKPSAVVAQLSGNVVDENLKGITFWIDKHNSYATREMVDMLNNKYFLFDGDEELREGRGSQAGWKRFLKDGLYSKSPLGVRAIFYFLYRYFIKFGFLDGAKGFIWHFMQGCWYRLLVDVKIAEIESKSGGDIARIREILKTDYNIEV